MYTQEKEAEREIKGGKKDLEKTKSCLNVEEPWTVNCALHRVRSRVRPQARALPLPCRSPCPGAGMVAPLGAAGRLWLDPWREQPDPSWGAISQLPCTV